MQIETAWSFVREIIGFFANIVALLEPLSKCDWSGFLNSGGGSIISGASLLIISFVVFVDIFCMMRSCKDKKNMQCSRKNFYVLAIVGLLLCVIMIYQSHLVKSQIYLKEAKDYRLDRLCFEVDPGLRIFEKEGLLEWFSKIREANPKLGMQNKPCLIAIANASKLNFENSTALWVDEPRQFFILDLIKKDWSIIDEIGSCEDDWCADGGPKTVGRQAAVKHFKMRDPPIGFFYPDGGIASYLTRYPDQWSRFGWLKEDCQLRGGVIFRLDFENGYILGPYPITHNDLSGGDIYVLYIDGKKITSYLIDKKLVPICKKGIYSK